MKFSSIITAIIIISAVAIVSAAFLLQPKFGKKASDRERVKRIEKSQWFKSGRFLSGKISDRENGNSHFMSVLYRMLKKDGRMIPREGEIKVTKSDLHSLPDGDRFVWFGHSSFLLRLSGINILVDPVFHDASPVSFINRPFPGTDIYKPEDMPDKIDFLLISHDHWDHLDYKTVCSLKSRIGKVICPLGVGEDFVYWGFRDEDIIELEWNENAVHGSLEIHCLPARHFTGRGPLSRGTMPASWLLEIGGRKIFYSGDGGYDDRFSAIGKKYPGIDFAIMENGQYNSAWNCMHTMPDELGREVLELGAKKFVTVHHSKYCLSTHPWDEPRHNEREAAVKFGLNLISCSIGEIVHLWE